MVIDSGYFFNAINRDIEMVRGDTMSFAFQLKGLEGSRPTAVYFTCKSSVEDTTPLFQLSLDTTIDEISYDPETDIITYSVRIPPDKTASLDYGRYFYDLEIQVNLDVFTLMRGRLAIDYDVTTGTTPQPPEYKDGDAQEYPKEDIPSGYKRIYTEQIISNIAQEINDINDAEDALTTAEMVTALFDIKTNIAAISTAINTITGGSTPIELADMAQTITDELDIKYPSGEEVYY